MSRIFAFVVCFLAIALESTGQLKVNINGQYMARAEYRHGYSTLAAPEQEPAFFISQRARLTASLKFNKVEFVTSLQDIRTWGSTSNQAIDDKGLLSLHEAWVVVPLNKKFSVKIGRQEIAYDEERIFGSSDWSMQARRHDAALLRYYDSTSKTTIHFGFAFNQDKEQLSGTLYTVPNNYKTFQYGYVSRKFGPIATSFLFLSNGVQFQKPGTSPTEYTTVFSQTFGPRLVYKEPDKKLSANAAFYLQTGKNSINQSLSGFDLLAEASWEFMSSFLTTAGGELISGTDEGNQTSDKSESFTPFYGTNHRFNGYVDYFYVNNHANSVGLLDVYVKCLIRRPKVFYGLAFHSFRSSASLENDDVPGSNGSRQLGTELDATVNCQISSGISIQCGYSQMFATKSMEYLKNVPGGSEESNHWGYVLLIVRPGTAWPRSGLRI